MIKINLTKRKIVLGAIIVGIVGFAAWKTTPKISAETFIITGIAHCYDTGDAKACYQSLAKETVIKYKLADIFKALEKHESEPKIYYACHETTHFIGQAEFKRTKNLSDAMGQGNPVCFAGYFHGVLEEYMSSKKLIIGDEASLSWLRENIPRFCANTVSKKIINECLHGLGHSLMYATDFDLLASLKLCDSLNESQRNWCYSGVFMENSTSSTNPDHPNQYLDQKDPLYPCTILEKNYLSMCYMLQTFYLAKLTKYDWNKTMGMCGLIPFDYRENCYSAIGQSQVGGTLDMDQMTKVCSLAKTKNYYESCISGVVGAMTERFNDGISRANSFCQQLPDNRSCFENIIGRIREYSNKDDILISCREITDSYYKKVCTERLSTQ